MSELKVVCPGCGGEPEIEDTLREDGSLMRREWVCVLGECIHFGRIIAIGYYGTDGELDLGVFRGEE